MKKNKGKSIDNFHTPFKGDGKFAKIFWAPTIDYITYCTGTIPVPICDSDTLMLKTVRLRQRLRTHNNFSTGIPSCEVLLNCAQLHRALVSHHPGGNAICIAALPLTWWSACMCIQLKIKRQWQVCRPKRNLFRLLFCQEASIARRQAQLTSHHDLWAGRHQTIWGPANTKDHLRCLASTIPRR